MRGGLRRKIYICDASRVKHALFGSASEARTFCCQLHMGVDKLVGFRVGNVMVAAIPHTDRTNLVLVQVQLQLQLQVSESLQLSLHVCFMLMLYFKHDHDRPHTKHVRAALPDRKLMEHAASTAPY